MMFSADITATLIFHKEGALAIPALASMRSMVEHARLKGLKVEARAVLDKPDGMTRHIVASNGNWLCEIEEVTEGDLGLARNAGVKSAHGSYLAFFDGDDLWGNEWLYLAYKEASRSNAPLEAIWHPEMLYYFSELDFKNQSYTEVPHENTRSFLMRHIASTDKDFDRDVLFLNNIWTANVFAHNTIHKKFPYAAVDRSSGLGIEDWSWNIETVWAGVPHLIVVDTVHLIRVKEFGSLGQRNTIEGLLPHIRKGYRPTLGNNRYSEALIGN